ncbi:MAG: DUF3540 domain-containing protein [Sandaracinaceae bacterium]|nr:DUF3540 domain-containing protein [Sandaracinaceae bacterium]
MTEPVHESEHKSEEQEPRHPWLAPATVIAASGTTLVVDAGGARLTATLARIAGYAPRPGDRVLVARDGASAGAIAVLSALRLAPDTAQDGAAQDTAEPTVVRAPDGASARVEGRALVVRDSKGKLLITHREGESVVHAQDALRFEARAIELCAEEQVRIASRRVSLRAEDELEAHADHARLSFVEGTLAGRRVTTAFERARHAADVVEVEAERIVERARETYREAESLMQLTAGRIRQIAQETLHLGGRRALVRAEADVSIKGERIELA